MKSEPRATAHALTPIWASACLLALAACSNGADSASGRGGSDTGGTSTSGSGGSGASATGGIESGGTTSGSSGTTSGGSGGAGVSGAAGTATAGSGGAGEGAGASSGGASGTTSSTGGASGAAGTVSGAGGSAGGGGGPAIVNLFNGTDLTGWSAYRETQATSPGTLLTAAEAVAIFKPESGTIRVYGDAADQSTQARHTLVTTGAYSKYRLWLEYRWGTKKFAPYTDLARYPRDAGILFHLHNDRTQVWPSSIEFQIKDGTTGDIFALYARCTSLARNGGTTYVPAADGGTRKVVDGATGFVQHGRSANFETSDWNAIELEVSGGTAVYTVNGHVVNEILEVNDKSGTTGVAVTSGPIALQAEHAEVFYRNIRLQVLP